MSATTAGSSIHQQCWDRACDCFATAKIFERRALQLRRRIDALSYLGIGVPAVFGAMVGAWGKEILDNRALMFVIATLGIAQVGVSVASLIKGWADEHAYSKRSTATNFRLSDEFQLLAKTAQNPPQSLQQDFSSLVTQDQVQSQLDSERHVKDSEKCRGHRHALKQFGRKCAECGEVPKNMKPSNCSVCGEFK